MTSDFDESASPLDVERLLNDALQEILSHEDPVKFLAWLERHIAEYDTGESEELDRSRYTYTALAATIGRSLWNATPLPSNDFLPHPLPAPKANDVCYCGSGLKYKECCMSLANAPSMGSEEIWPVLATLLSKTQLAQALQSKRIPTRSLIELATIYSDQGRVRKGIAILEPLFEPDIQDTDDAYDYALNLLCNLYDDAGFDKKKLKLIQRIIKTVPRSPLRGGAWQRLAAINLDQGLAEDAWEAFQNAQRDNPDAIDLGVLEVQLLIAEQKIDQAKARAQFWVKRLERLGLDDYDVPLNFLRQVINDPTNAMGQITLNMSGDAAQLMHQWLEEVYSRPLPKIPHEVFTLDDMQDDVPVDQPLGSAIAASKDIAIIEKNWRRVFPQHKPFSIYNTCADDYDIWSVECFTVWFDFLDQHPEAFDSLDILDDLATTLTLHPQGETPWFDDILLKPILLRAQRLIQQAIDHVNDDVKLLWVVEENRPALRSLARLSTLYYRQGNLDQLSQINEFVLKLNPDDNHGLRMEQMNLLLRQGDNQKALELANTYLDDLHPETLYGRVLALVRLGQMAEASQAAQHAIKRLPKIVRYLTHKRVKKPKLDYSSITYGGDDQAWIYRNDMREEWATTPGIFDWLKKQAKLVK